MVSDILLQFHAEWCGPCKKVTPVLEKVAAEAGMRVERFDIEEFPEQAELFNVKGVPTIIRVDDSGQETHRVMGAKPPMALKRELGLD